MNLFSLHSTISNPTIASCFHKPQILKAHAHAGHARDRVIGFGKYKGQMLGTIPSTYLKWVCKNLRARDFEEWAKLADEVLDDHVYRDRIEWEFAQKVLNGDVLSRSQQNQNAVFELLEISERFGWDNEDKVGWAKVDFGLLGTSKGGRIPRLSSTGPRPNRGIVKDEDCEGGKRRERRERLKLRRREGSVRDGDGLGIIRNDEGSFGNSKLEGNERVDADRVVEVKSPFPGREALLKKVLLSKRRN